MSIRDEIREEIRGEFKKEWEKEKLKNPDCNPESWWEERRLGMKFFLGFLIGIGIIGLIFLFGWVVMLLWNWLMPEIFGLTTISYWQAWGLLVLSTLLFKGMPGSGSGDDGGKRGDRRRRRELRQLMEVPEEDLADDAAIEAEAASAAAESDAAPDDTGVEKE